MRWDVGGRTIVVVVGVVFLFEPPSKERSEARSREKRLLVAQLMRNPGRSRTVTLEDAHLLNVRIAASTKTKAL